MGWDVAFIIKTLQPAGLIRIWGRGTKGAALVMRKMFCKGCLDSAGIGPEFFDENVQENIMTGQFFFYN